MNQIMHRARVIRVFPIDSQQNFGRAISVGSGDLIGRCRSQMGQRVESGRFRIIRECLIHFLHRLFPAADTQPIVRRSGIKKESFSGSYEELLAFCRWLKRAGFFDCLPSSFQS